MAERLIKELSDELGLMRHDSPFIEGRIIGGDKAGHRIRVEDDLGKHRRIPDHHLGSAVRGDGGDDWVETFDDIAAELTQMRWIVEWDGTIESLRR